MRSSRPAAVLTLLAGVALAACSGSPATSGSPSGTTGQLAMTALDYSFDVPATVQAGATTISLKNAGKEEHQAQLARFSEGKQLSDLLPALKANDFATALGMITLWGGPTAVLPGETGTVGVILEPGNYVFLCFIGGPDGVPHFAKGMVAPIVVTAPATAGELPAGDASLTLKDFTFEGLDTLTAGPHTVSITNEGPQPHEAGIVRLSEGVTIDDLKKALSASEPPSGPPPFTSAAGIAAIAPNAKATLDLDLEPGNYVFLCFVPDPATGKAHAQLGMMAPLTVE